MLYIRLHLHFTSVFYCYSCSFNNPLIYSIYDCYMFSICLHSLTMPLSTTIIALSAFKLSLLAYTVTLYLVCMVVSLYSSVFTGIEVVSVKYSIAFLYFCSFCTIKNKILLYHIYIHTYIIIIVLYIRKVLKVKQSKAMTAL